MGQKMKKGLSNLDAQAVQNSSHGQAFQSMLGPKLGGDLSDFTLIDVVQLIIFSRKTGALALRRGREESYLHFEHGQLVHATKGMLSGEEAAYSIFDSTKGNFEFLTGEITSERTINLDSTHFLMEAARRSDEAQRDSSNGGDEDEFYLNDAATDSGQRPRLSIIRNEDGKGENEEGILDENANGDSLADDLISAFMSCTSDADGCAGRDDNSDRLLAVLNEMPDVEGYCVYNQDGSRQSCSLKESGAPLMLFSDDDGIAASQIVQGGKALGVILEAGHFICSVGFSGARDRKIFFEADGRYVAADIRPGRHHADIAIKAFAGLPESSLG